MEPRAKSIRIGLFLLTGLGAMLAVALFLGRSRATFSRKVTLHAHFVNVSGLIEGAPVRLAGIDVGQVSRIDLVETSSGTRVRVDVTISGRWLDRVRADSVAELATMGLLGDMLVNVSLGSPTAPPARDGAFLRAREAPALADLFGAAGRALSSAEALTRTLETRTAELLSEENVRDLGRITRATAEITARVADGPGLAHALVGDRALADRVRALVA
ncbi:MlaD family protein, partial [Myxococcota bacterium]|nr:MlaD family protein [Myxococcota bacterium]